MNLLWAPGNWRPA